MSATTDEPLLTRFFIFEGNADLTVWTYVGAVDAKTRDQALGRHYRDKTAPLPNRVAVSENAWKVKPPTAATPTMPSTPAASGAQETLLPEGS